MATRSGGTHHQKTQSYERGPAVAIRWLLIVLLLFAPYRTASAHSWYDSRCCTDKDCHRVAKVEILPNGDRIMTADNGMVVEVKADFAAIHASQDNDYHICYYFTWRGEPVARCLYVPGAS
jgi:hypothetical protein